ncbi:hypothetical protein I0C86_16805 [Plantactinospora sp. S1510]|uniref:Uncharacterized protein n=1 Tax=Plantactinospora alkalitolerans TaxID=2789879 RepID=A0ABS0GWP6_9ACTN|nr:hypothetical protein [Plantactinospora alkalitolerans]MBF9130607.1 hypothetical protein [Plantactinospora alkalitolerans]
MTGDEPQHDTDLERRYRWLLAWYPWEHRRTYEDEMLGALLADARPGQRWPAPGDVGNLILTAVRARLGLTVRQVGDRAWHDASAVFGLLAALLLALWSVGAVASRAAWALGHPEYSFGPWYGADPYGWLHAGLWCLVVGAVLIGFPRLAASFGWVAVLLEGVVLSSGYATEPVFVVEALWPAVLGLVCAVALTVPAPRRRAVSILGRRRVVFIGGCFVFLLLAMAGYAYRGYAGLIQMPVLNWMMGYTTPLYLVAVAALLAAVPGLPAPIRRRSLVLLGPVVAVYFVVRLGLSGWAYSNGHMGHPVYLVPIQWTMLAGVPLLTFALGLVLLRRREQTLRLLALGRDIDRHHPDPPSPAR